MLKNPMTLYAIETTDNEYSSSIKETFDTFDDAMANVGRFCDWWSSRGSCTILEIVMGERNRFYREVRRIRVRDGIPQQ